MAPPRPGPATSDMAKWKSGTGGSTEWIRSSGRRSGCRQRRRGVGLDFPFLKRHLRPLDTLPLESCNSPHALPVQLDHSASSTKCPRSFPLFFSTIRLPHSLAPATAAVCAEAHSSCIARQRRVSLPGTVQPSPPVESVRNKKEKPTVFALPPTTLMGEFIHAGTQQQ